MGTQQGSSMGSVTQCYMKTWCACALGIMLYLSATALPAAEQSVNITVKRFSKIATFPEHRAPAVVVPQNDSKIDAEVTAKIIEIPVRVGQVVDKGTVLVRLQDADFTLILQREQAALKSLEARIELARYQLQRAQTLSKQQAVAEELLKQRETELAVLLSEQIGQQAALQQAKHNVKKCTVRAPFQAIISEKFAQVGELAEPGTPLLRIIDAEHSEVSAKLSTVKVDLSRTVKNFQFLTDKRAYELILRAITPSVDSVERTQEVRLEFAGDKALPGSAGELYWVDNQGHLPAEYLLRRKSIIGVFVVKNNRAEFVALPDAVEGRPARVTFSGDLPIVEKGRFRLQNGDAVTIK